MCNLMIHEKYNLNLSYAYLLLNKKKFKEAWDLFESRIETEKVKNKNIFHEVIKDKIDLNTKIEEGDKILIVKEQLKRYNTVREIIDEFYEERLVMYEKRRQYRLKNIEMLLKTIYQVQKNLLCRHFIKQKDKSLKFLLDRITSLKVASGVLMMKIEINSQKI